MPENVFTHDLRRAIERGEIFFLNTAYSSSSNPTEDEKALKEAMKNALDLLAKIEPPYYDFKEHYQSMRLLGNDVSFAIYQIDKYIKKIDPEYFKLLMEKYGSPITLNS